SLRARRRRPVPAPHASHGAQGRPARAGRRPLHRRHGLRGERGREGELVKTLLRWTLTMACASLLGCGFLGADGEDGTPVADGLAPFGPDEPVVLCVDGARIAETTSPPGLCRAEG